MKRPQFRIRNHREEGGFGQLKRGLGPRCTLVSVPYPGYAEVRPHRARKTTTVPTFALLGTRRAWRQYRLAESRFPERYAFADGTWDHYGIRRYPAA